MSPEQLSANIGHSNEAHSCGPNQVSNRMSGPVIPLCTHTTRVSVGRMSAPLRKWPVVVVSRTVLRRRGLSSAIDCKQLAWENASVFALTVVGCISLLAPGITAASPGNSYLSVPTSIPSAVHRHLHSLSNNVTLPTISSLHAQSVALENALIIPFAVIAVSITLLAMQSFASTQVMGTRRYWA